MTCGCGNKSLTYSSGSSSSSSKSCSSSVTGSFPSSSSSSCCPNVYSSGSSSSSCRSSSSSSSCSSSSSSSHSSSSCSSGCNDSSNHCDCVALPKDCVQCEKVCPSLCKELNCRYKRSKDILNANNKIKTAFEFLVQKLESAKPLVAARNVTKYSVENNINFLECFQDTLFCVLRKNKNLCGIKFSDCKVKNNEDCRVSDRVYLIKIKFSNHGKTCCRTYAINWDWTQLTGNYLNSYAGLVNRVIAQLNNYISDLNAQNTSPFLCC